MYVVLLLEILSTFDLAQGAEGCFLSYNVGMPKLTPATIKQYRAYGAKIASLLPTDRKPRYTDYQNVGMKLNIKVPRVQSLLAWYEKQK